MISRILVGAVSMAAGAIFVSAAAAAGSGDPSAVAASAPSPELMVAPPADYPDVRLLNGYAFSGRAAINPANPKRLVVGIVSPGTPSRCYVKRSADGGRTWGALVQLPQVADAECSSESWPFITYAAGGRLYAAYLYMKTDSCLTGVAFSVSTDQGATWSAPTKVFEEVSACDGFLGRGSFFASGEGYNDVRVAAAPDEPWVYVAAQIFHYHDLHIVLGSSRDQGASWTGTDIAHIFSDEPQFFVVLPWLLPAREMYWSPSGTRMVLPITESM